MKNDLIVFAKKLTQYKIYYECPTCFTGRNGNVYNTNLNKSGKVIASRKPTIHHHGNENGRSPDPYKNRKTSRCSHCQFSDGREVQIIINDDTLREFN